jgi:hypothetical protein
MNVNFPVYTPEIFQLWGRTTFSDIPYFTAGITDAKTAVKLSFRTYAASAFARAFAP